MTTEKAAEALRRFQAWRRYGGDPNVGPDYPDPRETGEAIEKAIEVLESLGNKPEKEYYGG